MVFIFLVGQLLACCIMQHYMGREYCIMQQYSLYSCPENNNALESQF